MPPLLSMCWLTLAQLSCGLHVATAGCKDRAPAAWKANFRPLVTSPAHVPHLQCTALCCDSILRVVPGSHGVLHFSSAIGGSSTHGFARGVGIPLSAKARSKPPTVTMGRPHLMW